MRPTPSLLAVLVLAHVAFGLLRVPHSVVARRLDEVDAVRREGYVEFAFRTAKLGESGAAAVAQLRATTPDDAVIAVRGEFKGALEYAVALLWPRLCCREGSLPDAAVASGTLVGDRLEVRLEPK